MFDQNKIAQAKANGVCFVCRTCLRYHEGEMRGLHKKFGEIRCTSKGDCCGPVGGGSFDEYEGPLKGYLWKYCYLCGEKVKWVLKAKTKGAKPIGCCDKCLEHVKKLTLRDPDRMVILVAEHVAGPDQFEEVA